MKGLAVRIILAGVMLFVFLQLSGCSGKIAAAPVQVDHIEVDCGNMVGWFSGWQCGNTTKWAECHGDEQCIVDNHIAI